MKTLSSDTTETKSSEEALAIITLALGDNPLRSIQNCDTALETWNRLQISYTGNFTVTGLNVLNTLLNKKLASEEKMGDHIASLELLHARWAVMQFPVVETIKITMQFSSLSNVKNMSLS